MNEGLELSGINLTPLKKFEQNNGTVLHAMKSSEKSFHGFGEIYYSTVDYGKIKGWKKHTKMVLNLVVPIGEIKFVIFDDRENSDTYNKKYEICLSQKNYYRLTIPPGLWVAFQGVGQGINMLTNIASIEHDPDEAINLQIEKIPYNWSLE